MSKKRKAKAAEVDVTSEELESAPLFESTSAIAYVSVQRVEPDEGYLGQVPPSASEATIFRKWGGGTFKCTPRAAGGQYIPKVGPREVAIAGDPIFKSLSKQRAWERQNGMAAPEASGAGRDKPLGFGELFLIITKTSEQARQEARESADLRMKEAEIAHQRQMELMREEGKRREHELELERRRLDAEAKEKTERLDREMKAERERQREHAAAMLQLVKEQGKEGGGAIGTLMAGIKLAMELRPGGDGGEAGDPLTAFAQNLPETIEQLGRVVALERVGQSAGTRPNPGKRARAAASDDDGTVAFEGPVGERAQRLYAILQRQGKTPAQIAAIFAKGFEVTERLYAGQRAPVPAAAGKPRGGRRAGAKPAAAAAPAARARAAARRPTRRPAKSPAKTKAATP